MTLSQYLNTDKNLGVLKLFVKKLFVTLKSLSLSPKYTVTVKSWDNLGELSNIKSDYNVIICLFWALETLLKVILWNLNQFFLINQPLTIEYGVKTTEANKLQEWK